MPSKLIGSVLEFPACFIEWVRRELLISTRKVEEGNVLALVQDSGPGLAPATLERLFESFYTTKPNGLGLGLSICRSIIEAHGGRLWASANVPRGAIFQFTVPAGHTLNHDCLNHDCRVPGRLAEER